VFFVFRQPGNRYTLWAATTIDAVNVPPIRRLTDHEAEYRFWIRFSPFKPLPEDKWVKDLRDIDLVGEQWRQGMYRFIDPAKEAELERLIKGGVSEKPLGSSPGILPVRGNAVSVSLAPSVYDRLQRAARYEGRELEDIIKEAVAEWLRSREG